MNNDFGDFGKGLLAEVEYVVQQEGITMTEAQKIKVVNQLINNVDFSDWIYEEVHSTIREEMGEE